MKKNLYEVNKIYYNKIFKIRVSRIYKIFNTYIYYSLYILL